ncbi:MAG TPA: SDR family oxidoreductase [Anaerolineae bacterium]|nr:SDR family oxidoreductase [Anaerolineae bacterium]
MRALVTGAAGFVGRHLIHFLLAETDLEIVGTIYRRHPQPPYDSARVHLEQLDLRDESAVAEIVARWRPDYIFHLAGQSYVPVSWEHPWPTFDQNVHTQINLFRAMLAVGVDARILVVGSGEEYGAIDPDDIPIHEDVPLRPASPYAVSKVAQDLTGWQYFRSHGVHAVRVRPFNHIGPGQNEMFVASSFARQIAMIEAGLAEPILRHGNLEAIRDFTDVRDTVRAYWLVINRGEPGQVYNVGSGRGVRIQQLLDILLGMSRVPLRTEQDPARMRPSDIPAILCDPSRLQQVTGWQPRIPLEQTLADILNDWRQRVGS